MSRRLVPAPRNIEWQTWREEGAGFHHNQIVEALLMDIRGELRQIRAVLVTRLNCAETLSIPRVLREIKKNTTKKPRKR